MLGKVGVELNACEALLMLQWDRTAKKRMPAVERHGEDITRRIGSYPPRKGADVAGWLVLTTRRRELIQRKS